jgi:hypothetical protein
MKNFGDGYGATNQRLQSVVELIPDRCQRFVEMIERGARSGYPQLIKMSTTVIETCGSSSPKTQEPARRAGDISLVVEVEVVTSRVAGRPHSSVPLSVASRTLRAG